MFKSTLNIRLSVAVLIVLGLAAIIFGWLYYNSSNTKIAGLLGGVAAGLFVAVIQFIMEWQKFESYEKLKEIQIKEVLLTRSDKSYYGNFIKKARKKIDILGVTGERFMKDFVDDDLHAIPDSKIVIDLLNAGVNVRILMPDIDFLKGDAVSKANEAKTSFERIKLRYPENFQVKYFNHIPAHSIFRVDSECIVGPVFPEVPSRYTPAIHFSIDSPISEKYLEYFEEEWKLAHE